MFSPEYSGYKHDSDLRDYLKRKKGIYIFYDSQGKPLYVGKAKKQNLWSEMNNAFNRDRETQKIRFVSHPTNDVKFVPASIKKRAIRLQHIWLHDMASYFSAYEVENNLIDNAEALLIRAFSNGLLNAKIENLTKNA